MKYLSYGAYTELGGKLDEAAFKRHIVRACGMIDSATFARVHAMKSVPCPVKALCRDLVEYLEEADETTAPVASHSQAAGGVSESVSSSVKSTDERKTELDNMIFDYLYTVTDDNGTPLLYRGCSI